MQISIDRKYISGCLQPDDKWQLMRWYFFSEWWKYSPFDYDSNYVTFWLRQNSLQSAFQTDESYEIWIVSQQKCTFMYRQNKAF